MPGSSRAALLLHPKEASVWFGPNQTLGLGTGGSGLVAGRETIVRAGMR